MGQEAERKFGSMPEWAKLGPIDVRNYNFRAEAHCARASGGRGGIHPTITRNSSDFAVWNEYFRRHLGGLPLPFKMLMDGDIREMTVPETVPQWFDPSFVPDPKWKPPATSRGR